METLRTLWVISILIVALNVSAKNQGRVQLSYESLMGDSQPKSILQNDLFLNHGFSVRAQSFFGELHFQEFSMSSEPYPIHDKNKDGHPDLVYGKNVQMFPSVKVEYFTDSSNRLLIPVQREPLRVSSGNSYWYILFSVGRVWKEISDKGMSRALIPFALMHPIDGETRNGVLTFLYDKNKVSNYQMQIVRQTSLWTIGNFFAWGKGKLEFKKGKPKQYKSVYDRFKREKENAVTIRPWAELSALYPGKTKNFEGLIPMEKVVANGLYCKDCFFGRPAFFLKPCMTKYGELPLCEESRFGLWSVGKSLMTSTAYLALAKVIGSSELSKTKILDVFSDFSKDLPPVKNGFKGWENVQLDDVMNMASGIGEGSHKKTNFSDGYEYHGDDDPNHPDYPYGPHFNKVDQIYNDWNTSFGLNEKLLRVFKDSQYYPWGPGEEARYRDRDYFIAGSTMSRIYSRYSGKMEPHEFWSYIQNSVFNKIGLNQIPIGRTIEKNESLGAPTWAWGIYPTVGEIIKIAKLIQDFGRYKGQQVLDRTFTEESLLAPYSGEAMDTGYKTQGQRILYFRGLWQLPFAHKNNCLSYIPTMIGWGGNKVALFPNRMIGLQIADHYPEIKNENHEITSMGTVANGIKAFPCVKKKQ